jgi:hypothetical protein
MLPADKLAEVHWSHLISCSKIDRATRRKPIQDADYENKLNTGQDEMGFLHDERKAASLRLTG